MTDSNHGPLLPQSAKYLRFRFYSVHHRDKSNKAFCIKVGTTVTFKGGSKNTGFVIDFGAEDPCGHEGFMIGDSDRPITSPQSILAATPTPSELARPQRSMACAATPTRSSSFPLTDFHAPSSTISFAPEACAASISDSHFLTSARYVISVIPRRWQRQISLTRDSPSSLGTALRLSIKQWSRGSGYCLRS